MSVCRFGGHTSTGSPASTSQTPTSPGKVVIHALFGLFFMDRRQTQFQGEAKIM
jgi:hypothetical protein